MKKKSHNFFSTVQFLFEVFFLWKYAKNTALDCENFYAEFQSGVKITARL